MGEADELDELIREARAEARVAVRAKLRGRFERELLDEVEARLQRTPRAPRERDKSVRPEPHRPAEEEPVRPPGEKDGATGLWMYCVAGGNHPGPAGELAGVGGAGTPRLVRAGGLAAVVSEVPLSEFGAEPLKRNLNDLGWLEATARAHEAVLDSVLAGGAIVPLRVCTIYSSEQRVAALLEDRGAELTEALEWLAGKAEWGVKVVADVERAARTAAGESAGGAGYLEQRKEERRAREEADALLEETVRECHARLEEWAAASTLLPAQRRELAGYTGEMILNAAYLVERERVDGFARVVEQLGQQYGRAGMSFDLTGPWPAYHFVGRLDSLEERKA